jgi:hypothetical protein
MTMDQNQEETRPRDKLDRALDAIDRLHESKALNDDVFNKCLVSLAYEYLQVEEVQFALVILNRVPALYYEKIQLAQMEDDPLYNKLVIYLAYKLIQVGVVDSPEGLFKATQPIARA